MSRSKAYLTDTFIVYNKLYKIIKLTPPTISTGIRLLPNQILNKSYLPKKKKKRNIRVDLGKGNAGIVKKSNPNNLKKNEAEEAKEYAEEKVINEDKQFS